MAYARKTSDRVRLPAAWLTRQRAALLAGGLTERDLRVLRWCDADGLDFSAVSAKLKMARPSAHRIYMAVRRKLRHPRFEKIVPAAVRKDSSVLNSALLAKISRVR